MICGRADRLHAARTSTRTRSAFEVRTEVRNVRCSIGGVRWDSVAGPGDRHRRQYKMWKCESELRASTWSDEGEGRIDDIVCVGGCHCVYAFPVLVAKKDMVRRGSDIGRVMGRGCRAGTRRHRHLPPSRARAAKLSFLQAQKFKLLFAHRAVYVHNIQAAMTILRSHADLPCRVVCGREFESVATSGAALISKRDDGMRTGCRREAALCHPDIT